MKKGMRTQFKSLALKRIKVRDFVTHKRHGLGRVVETWNGNIADVLFKKDGRPYLHSAHFSYFVKIELPEL